MWPPSYSHVVLEAGTPGQPSPKISAAGPRALSQQAVVRGCRCLEGDSGRAIEALEGPEYVLTWVPIWNSKV